MSSIANVVAFDGASTPVSHTLVPVSVAKQGSVIEAVYREQIASLPTDAQVSLTLRLEKLKSGVTKVVRTVQVPVMESISGQNAAGYTASPKVAYVDTDVRSWFVHPRSTAAGRKLVRQLAVNIDTNVSTSVTPATAGPVIEAVDTLVMST